MIDDVDFKEKHIVSIHNHPPTVYSPPSDKNFSILLRSFEDYELVASVEGLWILKAIGINPILNMDFKFYAERILEICQEHCDKLYSDPIKADEVCDRMYGVSLSNYINDKNINDIQLTKGSIAMTIKSKKQVIEYECHKKPTLKEHDEIRERINDPYTLTGIDKMRAFYKLRGLEFDENMLDNIIRDYHLDE